MRRGTGQSGRRRLTRARPTSVGCPILQTLARLGFEPRYGARPLKRAIEHWVIGPIARVLSARGPAAPPEVELVVRGSGVAVAPTSTSEISAMSADDVRAELDRRAAQRQPTPLLAMVIEPIDAGAGSRAQWLIERYAFWCESHGATVLIESGGRLVIEGAIASAMVFERGVHEFEAGAGIARVRVRTEDESGDEADSVRLYTMIPEPAVWDVNTELEWVGPWHEAVEGAALDRFVLARIASG